MGFTPIYDPPYKVGEMMYVPAEGIPSYAGRTSCYLVCNGMNVRVSRFKNQFHYLGKSGEWLYLLPLEEVTPETILPEKPIGVRNIKKLYPQCIQIMRTKVKAERYRGGYKTYL